MLFKVFSSYWEQTKDLAPFRP